jgi:CCR4-NOT complex subunit CAF16
LQILAGKRLIHGAKVLIKGKDVFRQFPDGVTFLGTEWLVPQILLLCSCPSFVNDTIFDRAMNPVVRSDITVSDFLNSVGGYRHKERRDHLLDLLDIDLDWHMHNISDGERRRVQLCMGLMAPWDVLLLDEVETNIAISNSISYTPSQGYC